jgi:hypothetical protein
MTGRVKAVAPLPSAGPAARLQGGGRIEEQFRWHRTPAGRGAMLEDHRTTQATKRDGVAMGLVKAPAAIDRVCRIASPRLRLEEGGYEKRT